MGLRSRGRERGEGGGAEGEWDYTFVGARAPGGVEDLEVHVGRILIGGRLVELHLMVIIYTVTMCASLPVERRTDQPLVPVDGGEQVVDCQVFVVGVGD